jgi:hypothetical protein
MQPAHLAWAGCLVLKERYVGIILKITSQK